MKILITGITGFIGSELAHTLLKERSSNYEIGGLVRATSNKNQLKTIEDIADDISIFYANFTDYHAIRNIVRSFAPNYIVHLGAQTAVRHSFEMPYEFNETNYLGTINLIHAALEVPDFKKFIFASTMETYGWQKQRKPFGEETILHPGSPYAVSKVACEKYLEMASRAYGLPYLISRACNTYGRKHNTGFIVEYIITTMLRGDKVYIGTPKAGRDLMYVEDHVNAYRTLLKTNVVNQTFNFGTGAGLTMLELAQKIKKKIGYREKIIPHFPPNYPSRPVVEDYLSMDARKAKKILGWKPAYTLDKGLDQTIAYWRKNLPTC
jgi:nucleoside-diphosphate-sugar epimerase